MSKLQPPFADVSGYAAALKAEVSDQRAPKSDVDFILQALRLFSDDVPLMITSDIGDDSTTEWELGKTAEPFADWSFGFSEARRSRITVEELASSAPQDIPVFLRNDEDLYRIEARTVSGAHKLYLVFASAPPATPNQYRVRWPRVWKVDGSTNEVRLNHQLAVVWSAAALKCGALAAEYSKAVRQGTTSFDGLAAAQAYETRRDHYLALYRREIRRERKGFRRGQVNTGQDRIFRRGYG